MTKTVEDTCKRCGFVCGETCMPLCAICDNETSDITYDERGWPVHPSCLDDERDLEAMNQ